MILSFDPQTLRFDEPGLLWLLAIPALLLALWLWLVLRHGADRRLLSARRRNPIPQRRRLLAGTFFWLCVILATAVSIVALARPYASISVLRTAGIDLVILQDASASMRVSDVEGNRWQRSMRFLERLGESLTWQDDRLALALFARIAAPQMRLTKDPNTFYFFLDHLGQEPPFRLEDAGTWDTNIEQGIYWGVRLVEHDQRVRGKSPNARAFILLSDGQAWSGDVARALSMARQREIPVYVIGVGTSAGGYIPEPPRVIGAAGPQDGGSTGPIASSLDRESLGVIATAGGGQYFELNRETDRQIANVIIAATRRRSGFQGVQESTEPLYWRCLLLAAALICLGALFIHERAELWIGVAGLAAILLALSGSG